LSLKAIDGSTDNFLIEFVGHVSLSHCQCFYILPEKMFSKSWLPAPYCSGINRLTSDQPYRCRIE
jgi:hypothetical protein